MAAAVREAVHVGDWVPVNDDVTDSVGVGVDVWEVVRDDVEV